MTPPSSIEIRRDVKRTTNAGFTSQSEKRFEDHSHTNHATDVLVTRCHMFALELEPRAVTLNAGPFRRIPLWSHILEQRFSARGPRTKSEPREGV